MAKSTKKQTKKIVYRDSKTGRFTSNAYALKHPKTTEKELLIGQGSMNIRPGKDDYSLYKSKSK